MADSSDSPSRILANQYDLIGRRGGLRPWAEFVDDEADGPPSDYDTLDGEDARRLLEYGEAIDETIPYPVYENADGRVSLPPTTTRTYLLRLRVDVCGSGHRLSEISAEEFNHLMSDLDADRARSTTTQAQGAAKHFFGFHDDLGVDPDEIEVFKDDSSQKEVDTEDVYTHDEIEALRREIDGTVNPIRNRALLEMLVYTGQRIRALQTLKIRDVHPEEKPGYINLNDEADGLKEATERGRYRPLLAARKFVREWKERHPLRDDPEAWFFIGQPNHSNTKTDQPWSASEMRRTLYRAAERAGTYDRETEKGKKPNPHAFRHYWYTSMRRDPDFDPEDLKAAGGWSERSNTPELVYKNFTHEEHMRRIEAAAGEREPDEEFERFIPETCPVCGEPLKPHWKQCPACDEPFVEDPVRTAEEDAMRARFEGEQPDLSEQIQRAIMDRPDIAEEIMKEVQGGRRDP